MSLNSFYQNKINQAKQNFLVLTIEGVYQNKPEVLTVYTPDTTETRKYLNKFKSDYQNGDFSIQYDDEVWAPQDLNSTIATSNNKKFFFNLEKTINNQQTDLNINSLSFPEQIFKAAKFNSSDFLSQNSKSIKF